MTSNFIKNACLVIVAVLFVYSYFFVELEVSNFYTQTSNWFFGKHILLRYLLCLPSPFFFSNNTAMFTFFLNSLKLIEYKKQVSSHSLPLAFSPFSFSLFLFCPISRSLSLPCAFLHSLCVPQMVSNSITTENLCGR